MFVWCLSGILSVCGKYQKSLIRICVFTVRISVFTVCVNGQPKSHDWDLRFSGGLLFIHVQVYLLYTVDPNFLLKFSFADLAIVFKGRTLHWFCYTTCRRFLCENTSAISFSVFFNTWRIPTDATTIMPT